MSRHIGNIVYHIGYIELYRQYWNQAKILVSNDTPNLGTGPKIYKTSGCQLLI